MMAVSYLCIINSMSLLYYRTAVNCIVTDVEVPQSRIDRYANYYYAICVLTVFIFVTVLCDTMTMNLLHFCFIYRCDIPLCLVDTTLSGLCTAYFQPEVLCTLCKAHYRAICTGHLAVDGYVCCKAAACDSIRFYMHVIVH